MTTGEPVSLVVAINEVKAVAQAETVVAVTQMVADGGTVIAQGEWVAGVEDGPRVFVSWASVAR